MKSPLSGIVADLVMEKFENDVSKKLKYDYYFYLGYIDIFVIIEEDKMNHFLEFFLKNMIKICNLQ